MNVKRHVKEKNVGQLLQKKIKTLMEPMQLNMAVVRFNQATSKINLG